jgi:hypothetical protein
MPEKAKESPLYDTVLPISVDALATGKQLYKLTGPSLFKQIPHFFDTRLSGKQRHNIVTTKQWQEYLNDLPCSLCGKKGGRCKCKPEDLIEE